MNARITARDVAIVIDLYHYRYLSFSQLARLHFPTCQAAYKRLRILKKAGLLKAFHVPAIMEQIYSLDTTGAKIVAAELETEVEGLSWYRYSKTPKDYYFLRHFLAINDFRMLITKTCAETPVTLLDFVPEYIGEKTKEGYVKKYIRDTVSDRGNKSVVYSHTPDAVFALEKEGNVALFFLEIDRGTESVSDPEKGFLKCSIFYLNYLAERKYQRYQADFGGKQFKTCRILVITPSEKRLQNMREAVTQVPFQYPQAKQRIWGTTEEKAKKQLLFESIWQSMDTTDERLYQIG